MAPRASPAENPANLRNMEFFIFVIVFVGLLYLFSRAAASTDHRSRSRPDDSATPYLFTGDTTDTGSLHHHSGCDASHHGHSSHDHGASHFDGGAGHSGGGFDGGGGFGGDGGGHGCG
jgi:hypothetical protein